MFGLAWLTPTLLGAVGIAVLAGLGGAWIAHELDQIPLSQAKAQTVAIQGQYDAYKASVAASVAKADADALTQKQAQDVRTNALQAQLIQTQKVADASSAKLKAILNAAAPGQIRPLGAVSLSYYAGLRQLQSSTTAASPRNP